jgi:hypothetical protein
MTNPFRRWRYKLADDKRTLFVGDLDKQVAYSVPVDERGRFILKVRDVVVVDVDAHGAGLLEWLTPFGMGR